MITIYLSHKCAVAFHLYTGSNKLSVPQCTCHPYVLQGLCQFTFCSSSHVFIYFMCVFLSCVVIFYCSFVYLNEVLFVICSGKVSSIHDEFRSVGACD